MVSVRPLVSLGDRACRSAMGSGRPWNDVSVRPHGTFRRSGLLWVEICKSTKILMIQPTNRRRKQSHRTISARNPGRCRLIFAMSGYMPTVLLMTRPGLLTQTHSPLARTSRFDRTIQSAQHGRAKTSRHELTHVVQQSGGASRIQRQKVGEQRVRYDERVDSFSHKTDEPMSVWKGGDTNRTARGIPENGGEG